MRLDVGPHQEFSHVWRARGWAVSLWRNTLAADGDLVRWDRQRVHGRGPYGLVVAIRLRGRVRVSLCRTPKLGA